MHPVYFKSLFVKVQGNEIGKTVPGLLALQYIIYKHLSDYKLQMDTTNKFIEAFG